MNDVRALEDGVGARLRTLLLALVLGASPAGADTREVVERWQCKDTKNSDYAVELVVFEGRETGLITAPGVKHETIFAVSGLSLMWLWVQREDEYFYFEIRSGRQGLFFDLAYPEDENGLIEARQTFTCNKDS